MVLTLRPAGDDDCEFLYRVYVGARAGEFAALSWSGPQLDAFLRMQFNAQQAAYRGAFPNARHSIILCDGEPAGRLLVARTDEGLRLVDISLLPERRGAGVGAALIKELQDEAGREGVPLRLQVLKTNPALRLYERLGFKVTEDTGAGFQMEWTRGE
jgi:ribosomal protein S18 acetylase RimI-like enzyme